MTLALAVALWMAGAGCLLSCESMVSAANAPATTSPANASTPTNDANIVVAADACASMQGHGCCAKRKTPSLAKSRAASSSNAAPIAKRTDQSVTVSATVTVHSTASRTAVVPEFAAPFSTMKDCPLAVNATAALAKARSDEAGGDALLTRGGDTLFHYQEQLTALTQPSLLPNRGHTYLRCCVFLI